MLRIVTDTASDITLSQARDMNIDLVPISIEFDDGPFVQEEESDFERFYEKLQSCSHLPSTGRPSPELYLRIFLDAKEKGDEVLVLTLSSGLSSTIESAQIARDAAEYPPVYIVDTRQAILTQRMLVECAVRMREEGYDTAEIIRKIEEMREKVVVCGLLDTVKYLQKGGRIPAGVARLSALLNIKPVIILRDAVLQPLGRARGSKAAQALLLSELERNGINRAYPCYFGYTSARDIAYDFMQKAKARFDLHQTHLFPVGGIIGAHCGTRCIAVAYVKP